MKNFMLRMIIGGIIGTIFSTVTFSVMLLVLVHFHVHATETMHEICWLFGMIYGFLCACVGMIIATK